MTEQWTAFIESREEVEGWVVLRVDCVPTDRVTNLLANLEEIPENVPRLLADVSVRRSVSVNEDLQEGQWIQLTVRGDESPQDIRCQGIFFHANEPGFQPSIPVLLQSGEVEGNLHQRLRTALTLQPFSPDELSVVRHRLMSAVRRRLRAALVIDVGQGLCCALLDDKARPVLFFDYGGDLPTIGTGSPLWICGPWCSSWWDVPVLVSHWHRDHVLGLVRQHLGSRRPGPMGLVVGPHQPGSIGFTLFELCQRLHHAGRLCLVSPTVPSRGLRLPFGWLFSGRGGSRNDSGLVLKTRLQSIAPRKRAALLLPGDVAYDQLPQALQAAAFDYLVASHHGGKQRRSLLPRPGQLQSIVYSYGANNSYRHPSSSQVSRDLAQGWFNRYDTPNGDVHLGGSKPYVGCCCGHRCIQEA